MMHVWIIGGGGMLGSAITKHVEAAHSRTETFAADRVNWADHHQAVATLTRDARRFEAEAADDDWAIIWAAGSSVVSSSLEETFAELAVLEAVLNAIAENPANGKGVFFLASSAGGVYAGSDDPPFDTASVPLPISPYGELKLRQERLARERLHGVVQLVIGRYSNLYGPGHDESKGQGLIPLLCLATVRRRPLNLFVSMETVRDYLYVDDAAAMTWDAIRTAVADQPADPRTVIIASGQSTTVAQVVATIQNVAHRRVPLALGTHPSAQHQAVDLRLVPDMELIGRQPALTPLPTGIKILFDAMIGRVN